MKRLYPLIDLLFKLLSKFSNLIKKDKNKIIVGANYGHFFTDNPRYIFEFLEDKSEFDHLFISKNKELISKLNHPRCVHSFSAKAFFHFLRSRTIICGGEIDIFPYHRSKNQFVINQWHGIPIKNIGTYQGKEMDSSWFDYILASSDKEKELLATAFNVSTSKVLTIGTPRNDVLINPPKKDNGDGFQILYAPTFRDDTNVDFFNFPDYNAKELDEFCSKNKITFKVKPHLHDYRAGNNKLKFDELNCVDVIFDSALDFQELLKESDVLITDYSGVYFDYLLLDNPIIFFPYDLEEYRKKRGFMYSYEDNTPGPKVYTQKELIDYLNDIVQNKDEFAQERALKTKEYHLHRDGKNTERLYSFIKENI